MKRFEIIAAALLAGLAGYLLLAANQLRIGNFRVPQTSFFPRVLAILLALLTVAELVRALGQAESAAADRIPSEAWRRIGATLVIMMGFALVLEWLGFLLATFALMVFLLRAIDAPSWSKVFVIALATAALSYGLFAWLLGVPLPAGILGI